MQNSADSVVPSSLDLLGQLEEEWRDTVQLHREEVLFVVVILFYFIFYEVMSRLRLCPGLTVAFAAFQKTLLRYYLYEGLRYVWLDRKGAFCRVRY